MESGTETTESKYASYEVIEKLTGLKRGSLYAFVSQGRIPHLRLGKRHVLFPIAEVLGWLESHKVEVK